MRALKIDFNRANNDQIMLKTNSGFAIPLERIYGSETYSKGAQTGVNNQPNKFYGFIEIDPNINGKEKELLKKDIPLKVLIKSAGGEKVEYVGKIIDKFIPPEERTSNYTPGFEGDITLSYSEQSDF